MEQHVKIVAILNIVLGGLGILVALFILLFFGGLAGVLGSESSSDAGFVAAILGMTGVVAFGAIAVFSLPGVIGGIGLLKFREWSRILAIVLSALNLISFPFGTALGIYGLWVLTKDETRVLFKGKEGVWSPEEVRQPGS